MDFKFKFVIAETFEAVVKICNIANLYVISFDERFLFTRWFDLINFRTTRHSK